MRCGNIFRRRFWHGLVEERAARLLRGHEAIDELIALPRGWLKSPRGVWRLRRRLHELRFDVALEAQGLTKAAIVAWLSGAPRRIGFGNPWGRELTQYLNNELVDTPGPHVVDRNVQLLRPLGIVSPKIEFRLPEHEADVKLRSKSSAGTDWSNGFAIINPGAGWPSKLWPTDRFAAVARYLGKKWNLPTLVVWAGEDEMQMSLRIGMDSQGHAQIAPNTTLTGVGGACSPGKDVYRFRHRTAAPCRGRGHALRGLIWTMAGRKTRSLRSPTYCPAKGLFRGFDPAAAACFAAFDGSDYRRRRVQCVR